jgi:Glycosyl hydrolases family 38 C-terminal domain
VARASFAFEMQGQSITKTVTLRAGSPWVEVALQVAVPPDTSAVLQTQDVLATDTRTDDLGFAAFEHSIDTQPIHSGDITYRRPIFYPIVGWSDVTAGGSGLSLLTHGLQAPAGTDQFSLLLLRQATDPDGEGVADPGPHTLRYAYLPHSGSAAEAQPWLAATAFNQPLIAAWRSGAEVCVELPFGQATDAPPVGGQVVCQPGAEIEPAASGPFAMPYSLLSADSGLVADLLRRADGQVQALALDYDPATPMTITAGGQRVQVTGPFPALVPLELP